MSVSVLIILVAAGVAGIALLLHVMGMSRKMPMSPEDARAAWHREFPDDEALDAMVSPDGLVALIRTRDGAGLVWSVGIDPTARQLRDFEVIRESDGLTIRFRDFSAPRVRVQLPPELIDTWLEEIGTR